MENSLQKSTPGKKPRKPTQKASRPPILKEQSVKKKKTSIDFAQRNIKSVIGLHKCNCHPWYIESTNCRTPLDLETFTGYDLTNPVNDSSLIHHGRIPRCGATLDIISDIGRIAKHKNRKSKAMKILNSDSEEDFEDDFLDVIRARLEGNEMFHKFFTRPRGLETFTGYHSPKDTVDDSSFSHRGIIPRCGATANLLEDDAVSNVSVIRTKPVTQEEPHKSLKKLRGLNVHARTVISRPCNILENLCSKCQLLSLNEPRREMPLAVIDLDSIVSFFEHQREDGKPTPGPLVNYFLASLYDHYDLAFWAKTSMAVLIAKLQSLEITTKKHSFKICFCLDNTAMINSYIPRLGNPIVKPLEVIWNLFEIYDEKNTILIDEEPNKFYFNKRFVLQLKRNCNEICFKEDPELIQFTTYLVNVAKSGQDLSKVAVHITNT